MANDQDLSESLPKERDLNGNYISFYQGFWCPSIALSSTIAFQHRFQAEDTDLIIASVPKSGTTWLKALTFAIVNRLTVPLSRSPLLSANPHQLVPSLELQIYREDPSVFLENVPRPRVLSTHMPYHALPSSIKTSGCRLVYICRNPLDHFISRWNFDAVLWSKNQYSISLEDSFNKFLRGVCKFGPIWEHVLGYWKASKETPNKLLFLKYEDLQEDTARQVKLLAEFLGFPFSKEEESEGVVDEVSRLCSFEHLKGLEVNKKGTNPTGHPYSSFFRKGTVGDWTNYLTPSMAERLNNLMKEKLEGSGLQFKIL